MEDSKQDRISNTVEYVYYFYPIHPDEYIEPKKNNDVPMYKPYFKIDNKDETNNQHRD